MVSTDHSNGNLALISEEFDLFLNVCSERILETKSSNEGKVEEMVPDLIFKDSA